MKPLFTIPSFQKVYNKAPTSRSEFDTQSQTFVWKFIGCQPQAEEVQSTFTLQVYQVFHANLIPFSKPNISTFVLYLYSLPFFPLHTHMILFGLPDSDIKDIWGHSAPAQGVPSRKPGWVRQNWPRHLEFPVPTPGERPPGSLRWDHPVLPPSCLRLGLSACSRSPGHDHSRIDELC